MLIVRTRTYANLGTIAGCRHDARPDHAAGSNDSTTTAAGACPDVHVAKASALRCNARPHQWHHSEGDPVVLSHQR